MMAAAAEVAGVAMEVRMKKPTMIEMAVLPKSHKKIYQL